MKESTIKEKVRAFFAQSFNNYSLKDDEDIFQLGFVNSLFAMQLVMLVESEFNLTVEDEDLEIANFRTVDAITSFVRHKSPAPH